MKRTAEQSNRKKQGIGKYIDGHMPLLMLLPASAAVIIVSIYPTLRTIGMSFFDKQLLRQEEPFTGLENYVEALSNSDVWQTIFIAIQ